jgi:hypothetical protein
MRTLKSKTPSHWAMGGTLLAPLLIAALGIWGRRAHVLPPIETRLFGLLTFGPKTVLDAGWWLTIPAGAATAYLLCRIERAFGPQQVTASV